MNNGQGELDLLFLRFLTWDPLLEKAKGLGSFLSCLEKGGAKRSRDASLGDGVSLILFASV